MPEPLTSLIVLPLVLAIVSVSSISRTLVAPVLTMSARLRTWTGVALSASICLRRLPVISTRCGTVPSAEGGVTVASCAQPVAEAPRQARVMRDRRRGERNEIRVDMG